MAMPGRRIPRNNGAYRFGEILAIRQSRQRIVASRSMGLTLKAGQLLVRFTESTCNAEKYQSRQNKRERRKRHHPDDEAPSLGNKIEFTGPPQGPEDLAFQTAFPGPGQRKYGQQSQRENRAYASTRQGHKNSSPSSLPDGGTCDCHVSVETGPPGPAAHIARKHVSEQSIILR